MLSCFFNVSFTLPPVLELDKGQDHWWLHVILYYLLLAAQQGMRKTSRKSTEKTLNSQNQDKKWSCRGRAASTID